MDSKFVQVIDSPMGSGKTSWAINFINNLPSNKKFIYITPFLAEISRIMKYCPEKMIIQPAGRKARDFINLIKKGKNISSTHALFQRITDEVIDLLKENDYILILDEAIVMLEPYEINVREKAISTKQKKKDTQRLLKLLIQDGTISIDEDNKVIWNKDYCLPGHDELMRLASRGLLYFIDNESLFWTFPALVFTECFSEIYVLTYQFSFQIQYYFFQHFGIAYEKYHIVKENGEYVKVKTESNENDYLFIENARKLIHIESSPKLIAKGNYAESTALSKNWYRKNKNKKCSAMLRGDNDCTNIESLAKGMMSFFEKYNSTKETAMWTCYKSDVESFLVAITVNNSKNNRNAQFKSIKTKKEDTLEKKATRNPISKNYVVFNSRSTNEFVKRKHIAYMISRFVDPYVYKFFKLRGYYINLNEIALAEFLQFIWRSAIRNGEEIEIYIPAKRVRQTLNDWLNHKQIMDNPIVDDTLFEDGFEDY